MAEKIKVNLSFRTYNLLLNDMENFSYLDNEGKGSRNKFINDLIKGFFELEVELENNLKKKIEEEISFLSIKQNKIDDLISSILPLLHRRPVQLLDRQLDNSISFRINKENEDILDHIEDNLLDNRSLSEYFRIMFDQYASLAQAEREAILFVDKLKLFEKAIENKQFVNISMNNKATPFAPYAITSTKEGYFTYVVGLIEGKVYSFHLYKINNARLSLRHYSFSNEEKKNLSNIVSMGADFALGEVLLSKVKLTKLGKKKLKTFWHARPNIENIEGDIYTFRCPYMRIVSYFSRFGKDAVIVYPSSLNKDMLGFYQAASKAYLREANSLKNNEEK